MTDDRRWQFIHAEFLSASVFAAFGHAGVYKKGCPDADRAALRDELKSELKRLGREYADPVNEERHLQNIVGLADHLSARFTDCLRGRRFRIGIAQKALNLYLKYLWCAEKIPEPPHCPFDGVVISHLPGCTEIRWTRVDSINTYKRLVRTARQVAGNQSLAEWELKVWQEKS